MVSIYLNISIEIGFLTHFSGYKILQFTKNEYYMF